MDRSSLLVLVRYHAWANERILATAALLSEERLRGRAPLDHGTAFDTLRHLVDVDWSWRQVLLGDEIGETYVWEHGFALDDLPAVHAFCREEDARLRAYVEGLSDREAAEPPPNAKRPVPRWVLVAHVVNHGTQHRSELARYLTECGSSPGELDLINALDLP